MDWNLMEKYDLKMNNCFLPDISVGLPIYSPWISLAEMKRFFAMYKHLALGNQDATVGVTGDGHDNMTLY